MTTLPAEATQRRYKTFRTIAIVLLALGVLLTAALWAAGAGWLGVVFIIIGLGLLLSARAQLAKNAYEPFAYDGPLDVVGEASYTDAIAAVYKSIGGDSTRTITAVLLPDPTNKFDPNAIAVGLAVGEKRRIVGYLPRDIAATVQPLVAAHVKRKTIPTVAATIGAPFVSEDGVTRYSVRIAATS